MRQKLNENPLAQVALVGVLLVFVGFLVISSMGGGESEGAEESASTTSTATVSGPAGSASVTATVTPSAEASAAVAPGAPASEVPVPPLPRAVVAAFDTNETVALLVVKPGGIEDRMVASTVRVLGGLPKVASFIVPADKIARYAAITQGVKVDRVPALVVVRPKRLDGGTPTASLSYGFQSPQSIAQAVIDANYHGRTYSYHP